MLLDGKGNHYIWNDRHHAYGGRIGVYPACREGIGEASIDPLGNTTLLTYDDNDRVRTSTDPTGALTQYDFDDNGNLKTVTLPTDLITGTPRQWRLSAPSSGSSMMSLRTDCGPTSITT